MDWTRSDTRYAIATTVAVGLALWLTLTSFGLGPSPLPRLGEDRSPRLAGLAFDDVGAGPGQPSDDAQAPAVPDGQDAPPAPTPRPPTVGDTRSPVTAFTTEDGAVILAVVEPAIIEGTAHDDGSGVATVRVTFGDALRQTSVEADLLCRAKTGTCEWSALAPGLGTYEVTALATDRARNTSPASDPIRVTVVGPPAHEEPASTIDTLVDQIVALLGL